MDVSVNSSLEDQISKYLDKEHILEARKINAEEKEYEEKFQQFHRDDTGRYVAQLHFKLGSECLGESTSCARRRYEQLEHRKRGL